MKIKIFLKFVMSILQDCYQEKIIC